MKCVQEVVNEIYNSCKIPFQLSVLDKNETYGSPECHFEEQFTDKTFEFNHTMCSIRVNAAHGVAIDLLIFSLKDRLENVFFQKQNTILSLISGKEVSNEIVNISWPKIGKNFYLVDIYLQNNLEGVCSILKEGYEESDIDILGYKGSILLLGNFDDFSDHLQSIEETISANYSVKYYIVYEQIRNIYELERYYKKLQYKLNLAKKYNYNHTIIDDRKLVLEGIIDSIADDKKETLSKSFHKGFSLLDQEMVKTIEVFFKCGLNISDASKELYIHRNTLLYRLDKIEKITSYDLRDFNSAVLFKIVFFIWKEKNK